MALAVRCDMPDCVNVCSPSKAKDIRICNVTGDYERAGLIKEIDVCPQCYEKLKGIFGINE